MAVVMVRLREQGALDLDLDLDPETRGRKAAWSGGSRTQRGGGEYGRNSVACIALTAHYDMHARLLPLPRHYAHCLPPMNISIPLLLFCQLSSPIE